MLVGDGSYLMMAQEIVTAVSEGIKLNIVLVQNHGFASIGALSESLGSQRFGTRYRYRDPASGLLDGDVLPVDLAANAASLGADVIRARTVEELQAALAQSRASDRTTVIYIETDPLAPVPSSESWWDVPVSRDFRAGQHAAGPHGLRGGQARPAACTCRRRLKLRDDVLSSTGSAAGDDRRVDPVRAGLEPGHRRAAGQVALAEPADVDAAVAAASKACAGVARRRR